MDKAIIYSSYLFVENFLKHNSEETHKIEKFLKLVVKNDLDINFDSKYFYLFDKNKDFFVEISRKTPKILLENILKIIENSEMSDSIRNANNRIHFRTYKKKHMLDSSDDSVRKSLLKTLFYFFSKDLIQNKLITFYENHLNSIKEQLCNENMRCKLSVEKIRIKRLLQLF